MEPGILPGGLDRRTRVPQATQRRPCPDRRRDAACYGRPEARRYGRYGRYGDFVDSLIAPDVEFLKACAELNETCRCKNA